MIEITGTHNFALVFTDELEDKASEQIQALCERSEFEDCKIRIMPDVHAGKGCTIGLTMTIKDKIVPGMVGVDIGCGMETVEIAETALDLPALDDAIRKNIPVAWDVRKEYHKLSDEIDLTELRSANQLQLENARHSIGTLGGGNHFIEVDWASDGRLFLIVHSIRHRSCFLS